METIEELCTAPKIRQGFFDTYDYQRWPSRPIILVENTTTPQIQTAANTFNQSVFVDPPPPGGATFALNCILVGDMLEQFSNTDHYALSEICGCWHSGNFKVQLLRKLMRDLLEKEWFVSIDSIYATYYGGDETTDADIEWKKLLLRFLPEANVLSSNRKGSFWNVDGTGPCGPCSTIYHYNVRTEKHRDPLTRITQNHRTMQQIWNFVFVKFNRGPDGVLVELPVEHVIAGMNLEAMTTVIQGGMCTYTTDVFTPLLGVIDSFAGKEIKPYPFYVDRDVFRGSNVSDGIGRAYRIIMDHLRMISVSTASDAQVGEQGRDTLLKFIDRHAIQLGVELLKIKNYPKLVKKAIEEMANLIPELLPTNYKLKEERLDKIIAAEVRIYDTTLAEIARQQGSQQDDADSRTNITWYKTRAIEFFDHRTHIIHKDKGIRCSIVALCNVLLLERKLSIGSDVSEVSESQLLCLLQNSLLCRNKNMKLQNKLERSDEQKSVLDVLSHLSSNIPLVVEHDSVNSFMNTPQTTLFDYLGVPLYHGCIADQDVTLAPGVSKLTSRGLAQLRIELKEKEPSVLFWNDSFITAIKVEGSVYLLLDDTLFVNEQTHMFWELLKEVKEGGVFMDSNFSPIDSDLSFTILPLTKKERDYLKKKKKNKEGADVKPLKELQTCQTNIPDKESLEDNFYLTKLINVLNHQFNIILQYKSGPCGLIAMCNVLILTGAIIPKTTDNMVHKDDLIECLKQYLLQRKEFLQCSETAEVLAVLPSLASFLTVNINFNRTDSFEETPPISLFRHLGISLYHGFLPDPSDATTASAISTYSYDTLSVAVFDPLFPNVDRAREFLNGPQLTNHGLHCLLNDLEEEMPCVLYKDSHFYTVIKIKGRLYAVATASIFSKGPVCWERFFDGGSEFLDSNFMPIGNSHTTAIDELPEDQLAWQQVDTKRVALRTTDSHVINAVIIDGVLMERASTLEEFSSSGVNYFAEMKVLFEFGTSVIVADTIIIGRIIALDLLHQLVQSHEAECSWNGDFDRSRIEVSGGLQTMLCAMIKEAFGVFSRAAMHNDYTRYVKDVLSLFEVKGVGYPAFFHHLIETLTGTDLQALSPNGLKIFFKKVLGTLALKSPLARAEFYGGVHRIRRNAPARIKADIRKVLMIGPPHPDHDWRVTTHNSRHPLLLKTLSYDRNFGKPKNGGKSSKEEDGESVKEDADPVDPKEDANPPDANPPHPEEDANLRDPEAAKRSEFGDYLDTLDSCTQFPRQVNEHAGVPPQGGQPYNEPYRHDSELDLLYSRYLDTELAKAHELLLTSSRLTPQLRERLRELFELLDRQEVFPPSARRR